MAKEVYTNMSPEELENRLENSIREYRELSFNNVASPVQQSHLIRESRREVARILTELRSREMAEAEQAGTPELRDKIRARRARLKKINRRNARKA